MSRSITIWVPGKPVPKGRPRVVRTRDGQTRTFTPQRTEAWESRVATAAALHANKTRWAIEPGRVAADLTFHGASKTADIDNLAKAVLDACNGILYGDDRQVRELHAREVDDGDDGVLITVQRWAS